MTRYRKLIPKPSLPEQVSANRRWLNMLTDSARRERVPVTQTEQDLAVRRTRIRKPSALQPTEHQIQRSVIFWWRHACGTYQLPVFALFAIPNGGLRDVITASKLKAEGVRPGIPDLMLARPVDGNCGLYIEMKAGKGRTSDDQDEVIAYLNSVGYRCVVCWTAEQAIEQVTNYLTRRPK